MINVFQPTTGAAETEAVQSALASHWLGRGPRVREVEAVWAEFIGSVPAKVVATTCASEGLFAAVHLAGVKTNDNVILPSMSFVAAAQAVEAVGAHAVFGDCDATGNLTLAEIAKLRTSRTRAVILQHYAGWPAPDTEKIAAYCHDMGLVLIEDAACAPGATLGGEFVGTFGDIGIWSFDAMKMFTAGDGGMLWFRNPRLAYEARQWLYLGMNEATGLGQATQGGTRDWWEFDVGQHGARRAIMNDVSASMLLAQLERADDFAYGRSQLRARYNQALQTILPGWWQRYQAALDCLVRRTTGSRRIDYAFWISLESPELRRSLANYLRTREVYTTFRYWPLHRAGFRHSEHRPLPMTDWFADHVLWLPMHNGLTFDDVGHICAVIAEWAAQPAG